MLKTPAPRRLLLAALLLLVGSTASAQTDGAGSSTPPAEVPPLRVPATLKSPRATLQTFFDAMNAQPVDHKAAVSCLDLSKVGTESGVLNATKLLGIINRVERIVLSRHPNARVAAGRDAYVLFEESEHPLTMRPGADGGWRFDADTVASVATIYDAVSHLPVIEGLADETKQNLTLRIEDLLRDTVPVLVNKSLLTLKYWQWLGLAVLIFVGMVLNAVVQAMLALSTRRWIRRRGGEASRKTIRKAVRPFGLTVAAIFWLATLGYLGMPPEAMKILLAAGRFFLMLAAVWAGFRIADVAGEVLSSRAEQTTTKFDDLLVPLLRKTAKVIIFVFGLIYIADSFDVEIGPLLAGLGIGGIGFAFAARDTLENLFGSLTVIADGPFQVGDWVVVGDVEGTVEDIGFRSTRVRTFYNSLITMPNGNLVRAVVDNYGLRKYRRWKTYIGVTYSTTPDQIDAFCEGIRELIRVHPYTRKDYYQVWLHQFGPSSLDVLVYLFFETPEWSTELRERHRFMTDAMRLADHLGIEFAFPTQTLHVHKETEGVEHVPAPVPAKGRNDVASRAGVKAVQAITANADWRRGKPEPYIFTQVTLPDAGDETQIETKTGGDAG